MNRTHTWRRTLWLAFIVATAVSAIWFGYHPPLERGLIVSVAATVFFVVWHFTLLRYLPNHQAKSLDLLGEADPQRIRSTIDHLIDEGRYALLLRPQVASELPPGQFTAAREKLEAAAALVPGGHVEIGPRVLTHDLDGTPPPLVHVPSFWVDRTPVTNIQFQRFVAAGGYRQAALWEDDAKPRVPSFVDRTGQPGPAFWHDGYFFDGTAEQPVVGVSWYEALAYARWAGKRLPTDAQWLKVASWPVPIHAADMHAAESPHFTQHRYPWGNQFEEARANLRPGGSGKLADVTEYAAGSTASGVQQLLGNVWEWTSEEFEHLPAEIAARRTLSRAGQMAVALKITRGGAFDTDLDDQSAAEMIHAECPLIRAPNVGFRCVLSWNDIVPASALAGYHPPPAATWLLPENSHHARAQREIAAHHRELNLLRLEDEVRDTSLDCAQAGSSDSSRRVEIAE
jgi:iron(II)-dependent oxidoreductase